MLNFSIYGVLTQATVFERKLAVHLFREESMTWSMLNFSIYGVQYVVFVQPLIVNRRGSIYVMCFYIKQGPIIIGPCYIRGSPTVVTSQILVRGR